MFSSNRRSRLSENLADQILDYIKENDIKPGDKLPSERHFASHFDVARTSVREGLRILESMGLVEVVSGRGTYLKEGVTGSFQNTLRHWLQQQESDIKQLVELREALETKAAYLAALRAVTTHVIEMEKQLDLMRSAKEANSPTAYVGADATFHDLIAQACDNTLIRRTLGTISEETYSYRMATAQLGPEALRRSLEQHIAIFEAIREKNPVEAWRAMRRHITQFPRDFEFLSEDVGTLEVVWDIGDDKE